MMWVCWFKHKWGKWQMSKVFDESGDRIPYFDYQDRRCERCGKTKRKFLKS